MKNIPFTIDYPVQLNDISADGKVRSWVIFDYLQDAAGRHADQLGMGLKQLRKSDLSWVLSRIRIQMDSFPGYEDTVRITTYPSGFDRLFAYRQFVLRSALTGKVFGTAGSAWLTLNPETFRPVSPAKYLTGAAQWEYDEEIFFQGETLGKIPVPDVPFSAPVDQRVSAAFVDYNNHLNNAFYAMFTEDWLGVQCDSLVRMTAVQVNFNNSTAFGEMLSCRGCLTAQDSFYVEGSRPENGKNAFQAFGSFRKILPDHAG